MYSSDLATAFFPGQLESIVSDPEGVVSGDDLETFHYPRYTLNEERVELTGGGQIKTMYWIQFYRLFPL